MSAVAVAVILMVVGFGLMVATSIYAFLEARRHYHAANALEREIAVWRRRMKRSYDP